MIKAAGQPPKSTFEKIKTLYWYRSVESLVTEELINSCKREIKDMERIKEDRENFDPKKLRTLTNKLDRLSHKGRYKKFGPKYSEMANYFDILGVKTQKGHLSLALGTKIWGRYASGKYTPSRILKYVEELCPGTKSKYENGPFQIFKIMESNFMLDAVEIYKATFMSYLNSFSNEFVDSNLSSINGFLTYQSTEWDKPFNFENVVSKLEMFEKILNSLRGEVYEEDFNLYGYRAYLNSMDQLIPPKALACLYLSLGYIKYKFLGDHRLLMYSVCRMDALAELEYAYRIPKDLWFEENKGASNDAINIFMRLKEREHFTLPDNNTLTRKAFPNHPKQKVKHDRFSGRKMI